ncbi:MAG TPA: amidohydrolase [Cytophagaceae bacterium]|jgi:predicted amidohydrolase|nr:amidohydrolase [Cytophagaceae bacterium]
MQDLTITILQSDLYWENPGANLAMFEEKIWKINAPTDLIVLPEMFTTGFTMNAEALAEPMNLTAFKWMKQQSAQTGAAITGSVIIKEQDHYYNRLIWMEPDGKYFYYDKRHLFRMAEEHQVYTPGADKLLVSWKGWNIRPLVCYDLRFPVWSRNRNNEYDLLLYVANWPEARKLPWKVLLQARAIENLSYVVGVNRVGKDGKEIPYSGDSSIISPKGEILWQKENSEEIFTYTLNKTELSSFRAKFPADMDADEFSIKH